MVSLSVDPIAEPADWTYHVLNALRSRGDAAQSLDADDQRERQQRLNEISRAAEEIGKHEPETGESPAAPKR